ncbi:uncharacterized protein LOC116205755 isoform X2 [Punica granatum]|uniref:Uncharacterized protein LOC116205755 isoform X2 n=1 Tax=Punica granatum TaxID=22663 RepID=A0A6P8DCG5_PUNGR|nr:uncharacterized protein LOC116205755 isoform X2 [Punica granatum]
MAEFRFPIEILRNVLKPLVLMANDANIFFDPNRGLRLKLVCFIGYVDAAVFFRKESLANFQCPNRTSSSIDILEFGRALHRLGTNGLVALHFDTEELVLRLRTVRFGPLTPERLLMEPTEERCTEMALMEERSEFMQIDESKFEYDLLIGIPSSQFRQILEDVGELTHFVTMYVKETAIWFKAKDKVFYLCKELSQESAWSGTIKQVTSFKHNGHCHSIT